MFHFFDERGVLLHEVRKVVQEQGLVLRVLIERRGHSAPGARTGFVKNLGQAVALGGENNVAANGRPLSSSMTCPPRLWLCAFVPSAKV